MSYRKWIVILSSLVLVAMVAFLGTWWWKSLGYVSTDDARIKAEIVSISAEIAGRIESLTKDEGDVVVAGEVMARLDNREILIQIQQAQAEVDRARSRLLQVQRQVDLHLEKQKGEMVQAEAALRGYRYNLENARVHAEQAREDWERDKELSKRKLISAQKLARAETELRQAEARVSALQEKIKEGEATLELIKIRGREVVIKRADLQARQAEVRKAKASLADLKHKLTLTMIQSPIRGVIVKKNAHRGEFVEAGQPIFMVVDAARYWVEANVEETKIRFVKPGSKVLIRVDSYPGRNFAGKVTEIGGATISEFSLFSPQKLTGVFIKSTQRLPVKIAVENTDGLLKVGMLAVVWIEKDNP
ncbi:MAG: HlyD family secretion protein [Candidatus Binatia bacterium]